jgi:hypothetical protein
MGTVILVMLSCTFPSMFRVNLNKETKKDQDFLNPNQRNIFKEEEQQAAP